MTVSWSQYWASAWPLWISAFCILAVYSYLFRDNAVYRTMVQVFIGLNVGYSVVVQWRDVLYPLWWLPMADGVHALAYGGPGSPYGALWAVVGLLGVLWYFQLSRKYLWLSRIVIGITVGIGAGLTFKSQFGQNMPQVVDSFRPLAPRMVAPQPRPRFDLPAATVAPVIDEPLAWFASDREVVCIETLNGIRLWRTSLPQAPSRLALAGDDLVVSLPGGDMRLDRRSGATRSGPKPVDRAVLATFEVEGRRIDVRPGGVTGMDAPYRAPEGTITSACLMQDAIAAGAGAKGLLILVQSGRPVAIEVPSGRLRWPGLPPTASTSVADGGTVLFGVHDRALLLIDPSTGRLLKEVRFAGTIGLPAVARMPDPADDRLVALVPVGSRAIRAVMIRDDLRTGRRAGETLWIHDAHRPVTWVGSVDGVLFAAGPAGGACAEVPPVPYRLAAADYANNWVFVVTLLSVMTFFFFSFRQQESRPVATFSRFGRWMLMTGFGAIFGNTVMTRMSYLLDRLMFLIDEWLRPFAGVLLDSLRHLFR